MSLLIGYIFLYTKLLGDNSVQLVFDSTFPKSRSVLRLNTNSGYK